MELTADELRTVEIEAPIEGEHEPAYTARCLLPIVRRMVEQLDIPGLLHAGEGGPRVRPVPAFGLLFYPDLSLIFHHERILAFEVKFLGRGGRQASIATALGQAYIYREGGYRGIGVFLVDLVGTLTDEQIGRAEEQLKSRGIEIVVRRRRGTLLDRHPRE